MFRARELAVARQLADVIDSFEHDQVANACLREHIMIEARQCVRPQSIRQQMVASNPVIQNAYIPCIWRCLDCIVAALTESVVVGS